MKRYNRIFEEFEKSFIRKQKVNFKQNIRLFEEMYKHAVSLGAFHRKNLLEGIENKIKIAKVINSVSKTP